MKKLSDGDWRGQLGSLRSSHTSTVLSVRAPKSPLPVSLAVMPPKSTSTTGKRRSSSSTAAISNPSTKPSLTRSFSSSKSSFTNLSATGKKSSTVAQAKTVPAVQENQDDDDEAKDLNRAYPRLLKQAKKEMGTPSQYIHVVTSHRHVADDFIPGRFSFSSC